MINVGNIRLALGQLIGKTPVVAVFHRRSAAVILEKFEIEIVAVRHRPTFFSPCVEILVLITEIEDDEKKPEDYLPENPLTPGFAPN